MAPNINNLMDHVYQYFLNLYQQADDSTLEDVFLAFEPIGRPIDPDSYKLNPTDSTYFPPKAIEEVTELTDDIPAINADVFRRTDKSVQEIYDSFLLFGATAGTADPGEASLFNHLKAKAQQQFEDTKIGKFGRPGTYRPSYADPEDWYDVNQVHNWKHYSYQMDQQQTTSQGQPPKIRPNSAIRPWQWQVLPQELSPVLTQPQIIKNVSLSSALKTEAVRTELEKGSVQGGTAQLKPAVLSSIKAAPLSPNAARTASLRAQPLMAQPLMAQPAASEKLVSKAVLAEIAAQQPQHQTVKTPVKQTVSPIVLDHIRQQIAHPQTSVKPVASSIQQASTTAVLLDTTYTKSVESNRLSLSFQYCIVHVDRAWFSHALLQAKGWYVPGFKAGEFSNGTADNDGLFPALPISFLVVKDLQISGWSQSEFEFVKNAMALGPFSLLNRKMTQEALICEGMQVIGWVSQVMPFMPPLSDPDPQ